MTLKLGMHHRVLEYYQVCSNNDPVLILTYLRARSNLVPYAFVWEKGKTMFFFRNYCRLWFETRNRWQKWQEVSVDIKTVSPEGCMPPAPGLYACIKFWKKCIKSYFREISLKLATNGLPLCSHQNFVPWGLSAPGLYTCIKSWNKCIKSWNKCIKSDFKDIFWELATNEWNDKIFLLTSKLCPLGAVCPCPGAIYLYKIMEKNV